MIKNIIFALINLVLLSALCFANIDPIAPEHCSLLSRGPWDGNKAYRVGIFSIEESQWLVVELLEIPIENNPEGLDIFVIKKKIIYRNEISKKGNLSSNYLDWKSWNVFEIKISGKKIFIDLDSTLEISF